MQSGFWDAEGLKGITTPVLFVAGSVDEVAGYEKGTRAIYTGAVNADRYLLTFINAGHNAAAPYPAPVEMLRATGPAQPASPFAHYADAVWDTTRMNNILQHFATAYFGLHLKGEPRQAGVLRRRPERQGCRVLRWIATASPTAAHTYWKGFKRGTAVGLVLEHASPER